MIFTVSPHGMLGFKVKCENTERIQKGKVYKIVSPDDTLLCLKDLNKCNEFITFEIQNWIISNKYETRIKGKPHKFYAEFLNEETIKFYEK